MSKILLVVGGMLLLYSACGDSGGPAMGSGGGTGTGTGGSGTGSGGSGATGTSGVAGSKPLNQLTTDEVGKLCDWGASLYGGYGKTVTCSDGSTSNSPDSRDQCVSSTPYKSCTATVGQLEPCLVKLHASCLAGAFSTECSPVISCLM